jgi:hypothetical protein
MAQRLKSPTDTLFLGNLDTRVSEALIYELCIQVTRLVGTMLGRFAGLPGLVESAVHAAAPLPAVAALRGNRMWPFIILAGRPYQLGQARGGRRQQACLCVCQI